MTFDGYKHPIQRADAIRYFVLSHYGGVYIDLDDGCKRRLDPLLSYTAWVRRTVPTGISNDIMGCVPQHPFFLRVIDSLQGANQKWVLPYITIMASTGPLFLSVIWKKWISEHSALQGDWPGRVRGLLPDEYNKHAWSFFQTYHGSSWHGKDAKLIFWMGRNWMLLTAAGFMLAALFGLAGWWAYGRILLLGAKGRRSAHVQMGSSKVGGSRGPLSRLWRMFLSVRAGEKRPSVSYELVEQHDA